MTGSTEKLEALSLAVLVVLSVVAGTVALSGTVAAASNVSISPSDHDAGATGVTYTAEGKVELSNQDTLQYVDVHISPADVSDVSKSDVTVYVDGNQYTDGLTSFSASSGTVEFKLSNSRSVSDGDPIRVVVADVTNPSSDFSAKVTLHDTGDAKWQTFSDTVSIDTPPSISSYAVSNPTGRDVAVSFNSSKELTNISVEITDSSGATVATLTESDFTETQDGGTYVYDATHTVSEDGEYTATLVTAADSDGDDGATGQSGTARRSGSYWYSSRRRRSRSGHSTSSSRRRRPRSGISSPTNSTPGSTAAWRPS